MSRPPLALAIALLALPACTDDEPAQSADCVEAATHSDLTFIQDKIFTPSCAAFSACHQGAAISAGGLSLDAGVARMALVDKPSRIDPSKSLVKPGNPMDSYLLVIMGKVPGIIDPKVGFMPSANQRVCEPKLDAIARWISSGAL